MSAIVARLRARPAAPVAAARHARRARARWSAPCSRLPAARDAAAARRRHGGALHPRHRRHLRHHAGRHRPVDPVHGLARQRHRGADASPGSATAPSRSPSRSARSPACSRGLAHVRLQHPLLHRHAGHGRRALQHRAGHLAASARSRCDDTERGYLTWITGTTFGIPQRGRHRPESCSSSPTSCRAAPRFGRYSAAIGAGEPAAYASGVKVNRQKVIAFVLSGALRGARRRHPRRPPRQRLADAGRRAAAALDRRRGRRRHGDHRRRRQHLAHAGRRADHLGRAHRHDLPRRQHLRPEHRLRRRADRWPSPSPSTAPRSRSSNSGSRAMDLGSAGQGRGDHRRQRRHRPGGRERPRRRGRAYRASPPATAAAPRSRRARSRPPTACGRSAVAADVATAEGCAQLVAAVEAAFGGGDILINNAGTGSNETIMEAPDEKWQHYWDLHVMAAVRLARGLVPSMMQRAAAASSSTTPRSAPRSRSGTSRSTTSPSRRW